MRRRRFAHLLVALSAAMGFACESWAADPALPPGLDPGGPAIALISTGVDYADPQIAARLARDGEGQLIGWDFVDNDITPFGADVEATRVAKLVVETNPNARLVIVRVIPGDVTQLVRAAAFVDRTPARVLAILDPAPRKPVYEIALRLAGTFVIVPPDDATPEPSPSAAWTPVVKPLNMLVVAPLSDVEENFRASDWSAPAWNNDVDAWVRGIKNRKAAVGIGAAIAACVIPHNVPKPTLSQGNALKGLREAFDARLQPHAARSEFKTLASSCGED